MSTIKARPIAPRNIVAGMDLRVIQTYPNGLAVTTEGRAHSLGNGSSILIGDHDDYVEVKVQHSVAGTSWFELVALPEKTMAVVLVKQPTGDLLPAIREDDDVWVAGSHRTSWTNDEVLAQLECVLWEGQES